MKGTLIILAMTFMYGSLMWCRSPGHGGRFGAAIRRSDQVSARFEVERLRKKAARLNAKADLIEREAHVKDSSGAL